MDTSPLDPADAEARFAQMLDEAALPRFTSAHHDAASNMLELTWDHGLTIHVDLTVGHLEPLRDWERNSILGLPFDTEEAPEPIHVTVPGAPGDPREDRSIPGIVIHRCPPLHPDDLTVHNGIPVTSVSRTLIDCAECMDIDELRELFASARDKGMLDPEALRASRARVEWRPSLALLDEVIDEFCP